MKNKLKNKKGFTLIEVIIYVALFTTVMTGALVSVYAILESNSRNQTKAMVASEGAFLLGKIDWALNGKQIASLSHSDTTWILTTSKLDGTNTVKIKIDASNKMQIDRSAGYKDLNNSNVEVLCPIHDCFIHTPLSGDGINPEKIEAKFTLSSRTNEGQVYSQEFSTVKFLRK